MLGYIIRRLLQVIPVLWLVATSTFFLMHAAPGGPFDSERQISAEIQANINARYHLDEPLGKQYLRYLQMLASGDLGPSFRYADRSVNEIIATTFPVSAMVGLIGLFFALSIGLSTGIFAASKLNSWRDYSAMLLALLGISLPSFVVGPLMILLFSIKLGWFSVSGYNRLQDLLLPGLTMGIMYAAFFARLTRGGISEIIRQDFIRTAKAKGLSNTVIMLRHTLKGGLLPATSFLGPAATAMLTGSLVVETIFNLPGLGRFFVQSALNRDYTLVMGCVLFLAVLIVIMNLLVDLAYAFLDPRVTYD